MSLLIDMFHLYAYKLSKALTNEANKMNDQTVPPQEPVEVLAPSSKAPEVAPVVQPEPVAQASVATVELVATVQPTVEVSAVVTPAVDPAPPVADPVVPVDPKQACAIKKINFNSVPISLRVLAAPANDTGAEKYGTWNWLKLPDGSMSLNTYLNGLDRHLTLYRAGQDLTSDTGIHNLDAMIAGLSVVRDAMIFGKVNDDRIKLTPEQIKILEDLIDNPRPSTLL